MVTPVTTYAEIRRRDARSRARALSLSVLSAKPSRERLQTPRVQIVYLHHVFDDEVQAFRRLLGALQRDHEFVGYSEAMRRVETGEIDKAYLAVTFDDGFASCLPAARVMDELGIAGCFFVCPAIVSETRPESLQRICAERFHLPPVDFMSWAEIESLLDAGHEVGSHSMTHLDLGSASPAQLHDEIAGSYEELTRRLGRVDHFAWPYGRERHFSEEARRAVFAAGYSTCASALRGCYHAGQGHPEAARSVRRDHVIAGWPLRHVLYFLARNARAKDQLRPAGP